MEGTARRGRQTYCNATWGDCCHGFCWDQLGWNVVLAGDETHELLRRAKRGHSVSCTLIFGPFLGYRIVSLPTLFPLNFCFRSLPTPQIISFYCLSSSLSFPTFSLFPLVSPPPPPPTHTHTHTQTCRNLLHQGDVIQTGASGTPVCEAVCHGHCVPLPDWNPPSGGAADYCLPCREGLSFTSMSV